MANLLGYSALCILMICTTTKVQSQTTSLFGTCVSSDEGATDAPEDADETSQNNHRGCGQGQVAVYVAALIKGQKLLRDQALAVSEYASESRGTLATLNSLYQSLQNRTARRDEQLTRQLHLSEQEISNVTTTIAALQRGSSRLDLELRGAATLLASNITALQSRIDETEAISQALVEREVKLTWDELRALNQTVSQGLIETQLATRECRNYTEDIASSLAKDVAAIESDVHRLRRSANASIIGLGSTIEQLAVSVLNVAAEANTSVSASRELLLTVSGALNRSLLRIYEELGHRIGNASESAMKAAASLEQLRTTVLEESDSLVVRFKQLEVNFDGRISDFQVSILRLDNITGSLAHDMEFFRNVSAAQQAAIVAIEATISGLSRSVDSHAQLTRNVAADLEARISRNFSRDFEEERRRTIALIGNVSMELMERLDNVGERVSASQLEHVRDTMAALKNVSDSTERIRSILANHFDQAILDARTSWMSAVESQMTVRLDSLLENVTNVLSEELALHSLAVRNVSATGEENLMKHLLQVNQSQELMYEHIAAVATNASRGIDAVAAGLSLSIDTRMRMAEHQWTSALAHLNASLSPTLASNDAVAKSLLLDFKLLRNSTSHTFSEYASDLSAVRCDLEAQKAKAAADAVLQNQTMSQLDTSLVNSDQYMRQKFQELASAISESSLNVSSIEAAMLLRANILQNRIERASAESAGAINSLNDTLRSFESASSQAEVSTVRQQLSQLQDTLQQARDDLTALRTAQESLRQSSRTQADLDALSTELIQQVRTMSAACPAGWTARGTSCYYFVSPPMVWEDAARACFALGATLVEIEDRSEDLFIKDFFTSNGVGTVWIGLHDRSTEGQWHWTSGQSNAYRNWAPDEPNNSNNEDCAHADARGSSYGWNDHQCNQITFASVCERRIR